MRESKQLDRNELLELLWVIFLIEGDCRASVPFGWLRRKAEWKARKITFMRILIDVAKELRHEYAKWQDAQRKGYKNDFLHWLAVEGYNANPDEWRIWEKNARAIRRELQKI